MRQNVNLCNEIENARPVFKSKDEYEAFRKDFRKAVLPFLKKHAQAHRDSQRAAMRHVVI